MSLAFIRSNSSRVNSRVLRSGEQFRDRDEPGHGIGSQKAQVKQRMYICPQQQPVGHVIGSGTPVGAQVGTFQGQDRIKAGDSAPPAIGFQQPGPERGLSLPGNDLPVDAKASIAGSNPSGGAHPDQIKPGLSCTNDPVPGGPLPWDRRLAGRTDKTRTGGNHLQRNCSVAWA